MKKNKILKILLLIGCLLTASFSIASCEDVSDSSPSKHTHSFNEWTLRKINSATCEKGRFFRECDTCGEMEWRKGTEADHDWMIETTAPTCKMQGYDTKTCATCDMVKKDNYTEVIEHDWEIETQASTCKEQGYDAKVCSACGESVIDNYTEKLEHVWLDYEFNDKAHWHKCSNCDTVEESVHKLDENGACATCDYFVHTGGVTYEVKGVHVEVIGYTGTSDTVVILDSYLGLPVSCVNMSAFAYCKTVTNVIIPDCVTAIQSFAFYGCSNLKSVSLGNSVSSIGNKAFSNCEKLENINIPASVISIGGDVFKGTNLQYNVYDNGKYLGNEENPYHALIEQLDNTVFSCRLHDATKVVAGGAFGNNLSQVIVATSIVGIGNKAWLDETVVYYLGSEDDWNEIAIEENFYNTTPYYYSETKPSYEGNYWHYDANGEVEIWQ